MHKIKNYCILILLLLSLSNCVSIDEVKERAKGDGVPYIPGI